MLLSPFHKSRKPGWLDLFLCAGFVAFLGYVGYRVEIKLDYHWNWTVIPQYLLRQDPQTGSWLPNLLLTGLLTTIRLSLWSMFLATLLGGAIGLFRVSSSRFKRLLGQSYVGLIRNLPPLVLVFIFYFFVSSQLMQLLGVEALIDQAPKSLLALLKVLCAPPELLVEFFSAVLTLALFEGAYIAEIVRGGIQSIEKGQWEGAFALGLTRRQQLRWVVLPQALQRILPPLAGQFISTIKDSAIVSVISIQELTFQGMEIMAATYLTLEVWLTVTLLYFLLTYSCSLLVGRFEAAMRRRHGAAL